MNNYNTPATATKNETILLQRQSEFNKVEGPRVGDFLKMPYGLYTRFTHAWDDSIQTGGSASGGGFYLGNGYTSYSGGLNSGVDYTDIKQTEEVKDGCVWFFDDGIMGANRGVYFNISFRVFELKEGANTKGLPEIKAYEKKLIQDQAEKITRIDGNGNEYTTPLPELVIMSEYLNDGYLAHLNESTGLNFVEGYKGSKCYVCQPMTCQQFTKLMLTTNFETKYYNNSMHNNTLFLTFRKDN